MQTNPTLQTAIAVEALQWLCSIAAELPASITNCAQSRSVPEPDSADSGDVGESTVYALAMAIEQTTRNRADRFAIVPSDAKRAAHCERIALAIEGYTGPHAPGEPVLGELLALADSFDNGTEGETVDSLRCRALLAQCEVWLADCDALADETTGTPCESMARAWAALAQSAMPIARGTDSACLLADAAHAMHCAIDALRSY